MNAKNIKDVKEETAEFLEDVKAEAKDVVERAKKDVKQAVKIAKGDALVAEKKLEHAVEENPMRLVLIAAGIGLVLGIMVGVSIAGRRQ